MWLLLQLFDRQAEILVRAAILFLSYHNDLLCVIMIFNEFNHPDEPLQQSYLPD